MKKEKYLRPATTKNQIRCETTFATSKISSVGCYEIEDFNIFNDDDNGAFADFEDRTLGDHQFDTNSKG